MANTTMAEWAEELGSIKTAALQLGRGPQRLREDTLKENGLAWQPGGQPPHHASSRRANNPRGVKVLYSETTESSQTDTMEATWR